MTFLQSTFRSHGQVLALLLPLATLWIAAPAAAQERARLKNPKPASEAKTTEEAEPETSHEQAKAAAAAESAGTAKAESSVPSTDRSAPRGQGEASSAADILNERLEVTEVLLDVLVTDSKGNVVTGLEPTDFVVEEENERVEVTGAIFYGSEAELSSSGGPGAPTRSDRYFILMFHDQRRASPALFRGQLEAARRARAWVTEELLPNDQVAVLSYDVKLKVHLDFSRDEEQIQAAISNAATSKKGIDSWRQPAPRDLSQSPTLLANLPAGKELAKQSRTFQEAMALVGTAAEGILGRKNLLLFSLGFEGGNVDGPWLPDQRYYPDMRESLNAGNVAVYSIDLAPAAIGVGSNAAFSDSLNALSADTGGRYFHAYANLIGPLRDVAEDNRGYYLISYRTRYPAGTTGYREVKVAMRDSKHRLRARRGYRFGQVEIRD